MLYWQLCAYVLLSALWSERNQVFASRGRQEGYKPPQLLVLLNFLLSWCLLHSIAFVCPWYLGNFGEGWKVGKRGGGRTLEAGQRGEERWCGNCGVGSGFNFSGHSSDDDWLLCSPGGRLTTSPPIPLPPLKSRWTKKWGERHPGIPAVVKCFYGALYSLSWSNHIYGLAVVFLGLLWL